MTPTQNLTMKALSEGAIIREFRGLYRLVTPEDTRGIRVGRLTFEALKPHLKITFNKLGVKNYERIN
jgi:hypothetical protein